MINQFKNYIQVLKTKKNNYLLSRSFLGLLSITLSTSVLILSYNNCNGLKMNSLDGNQKNQLLEALLYNPEATGIEAYTETMYQNIMERPSDSEGKVGWMNAYATPDFSNCQALTYAFIDSPEFRAKLEEKKSQGNEAVVSYFYTAFLWRGAEEAGFNY